MNLLAHESSLYLRQHAANPVDWVPWGDVAWQRARDESRLVIVSIGFSACHWCHVMERESFEDPDIAAFMNRHFVCIKVDREERPDVDRVYLAAIHALTGMNGWPLHAICLPDGRPIAGGTYFPPRRWLSLLLTTLTSPPPPTPTSTSTPTPTPTPTSTPTSTSTSTSPSPSPLLDPVHGGLLGAPKFPLAPFWRMTLHEARGMSRGVPDALRTTLNGMLAGGIHDRLGGGICRYAVDEAWRFPHFEKMLTDQACMLDLLARAVAAAEPDDAYTKRWRVAAEGIAGYVMRDLGHPGGGFASSQDADSAGSEGAYSTWTAAELAAALPDAGERAAVLDLCGIGREAALPDGRNVLLEVRTPTDEERRWLDAAYDRLQDWRTLHKVPPTIDPLVTSGSTALMASALVTAGCVFGRSDWVQRGEQAMRFVLSALRSDRLHHHWNAAGGARGAAFCDDIAYAAAACLDLYEATFRPEWHSAARELAEEAAREFIDLASGRVRYASAATEAPPFAEAPIDSDGTLPSPAAVLAEVGSALGLDWADAVLAGFAPTSAFEVVAEARAVEAKRWAVGLTCRVAPRSDGLVRGLRAAALPGLRLVADDLPDGIAVVCGGGTCDAPARSVEEIEDAWRRRANVRP